VIQQAATAERALAVSLRDTGSAGSLKLLATQKAIIFRRRYSLQGDFVGIFSLSQESFFHLRDVVAPGQNAVTFGVESNPLSLMAIQLDLWKGRSIGSEVAREHRIALAGKNGRLNEYSVTVSLLAVLATRCDLKRHETNASAVWQKLSGGGIDFQVRLSIDLWSVPHREPSSATFCLGELTAYVISARAFSIPVNLAWAVARTTEVRYLR
jgi:hypothetical protein